VKIFGSASVTENFGFLKSDGILKALTFIRGFSFFLKHINILQVQCTQRFELDAQQMTSEKKKKKQKWPQDGL